MKVRNGFVSNSSSSSFVVKFPREPKSAQDVKDMMFPHEGCSCTYEEEEEYYDYKTTKTKIAKQVWRDIEWQDKEKNEEILDKIKNDERVKLLLSFDVCMYEIMRKLYPNVELGWREQRGIEEINESNIKGEYIYHFEYSDNDGEFQTIMEHGNVFRNLEHTKTSHH